MDAIKKTISVIEPVSEAIEKTKIILFRPFDAEKWLVIGFCAISFAHNPIAGAVFFPCGSNIIFSSGMSNSVI